MRLDMHDYRKLPFLTALKSSHIMFEANALLGIEKKHLDSPSTKVERGRAREARRESAT